MAKRKRHFCIECRHLLCITEATLRVEHPNPKYPNLLIQKWVCDDHYEQLSSASHYGKDLKVCQGA